MHAAVINCDHENVGQIPDFARRTAADESCELLHGRTVAAKRSSFPVRVSFHIRWMPQALAAMPCQSLIHKAPCLVPVGVLPVGLKEAVVRRTGGRKLSW